VQIAHSFLAILAGFVIIVGLTGIATLFLRQMMPSLARIGTKPDAFAMIVNIGLGLIFSMLGGYVTARYSRGNPIAHAFMLAIVVLLLGAISAVQMKSKQPVYYLILSAVIPPLSVLAGGLLWLHQTGVLHW
jgi:hypothetical protein